MNVIVISLREATARRAHVAKLLDATGTVYEFFDAITGEQAIDAGEFSDIDAAEFLVNTGRRITAGEIGCFASHRRIWQRCAATRSPVIILEDDFELVGDFAAAIRATERLLPTSGFIRMHTDIRGRKHPVWRDAGISLHRFTKPPHGLMAYALTPRVAQSFVEQTATLAMPVDVFTKRYWDHGFAMYALLPYTFTHSKHHQSTTIRGRRRTSKPLAVAVRRFTYRCVWQWQRLRFNLLFKEGDHTVLATSETDAVNVSLEPYRST